MSATYTDRTFRRVTHREPCPVCKHDHWCRRFEDGAVECMRVESLTPCKSGGWMHWPHGRERDWRDQLPTPPRRKPPERPAGEPAQVDAAYRALLALCPLSEADRAHLEARGLTAEQVARHGYATLPAERAERSRIAAAVEASLGWDPAGVVPGFVRTGARLELAEQAGILIPFRTAHGQIRGLQVRLTHSGAGPKYVWFSAGDGPGSIGQNGNLCHVARPARPTSTRRVVVTEGPIKANITADRFGCIVLAVAGVANIAGVLPALKALGGVEDVAIAYDADAEVNEQVAMHEAKLALALDAAGYRVAQWTWLLEDGKGIDDLIVAGLVPFPIPHPALTRDRQAPPDEPADATTHELVQLRRLHALSVQARRSPNLGAERHLLTDLALAIAGAPEGQPVPMPYPKLGDQAGVSASTAERQLAKVGIRPSAGDAGILAGLVAVDVRPVPEQRNEATGQLTGGYDCLHVRRLAPVRDILERIATAPVPETGKRNNHGGRADRGCPRCGETKIQRTITDRCAGCGELIKQTTRTIAGDEGETPPPQDAATPPSGDAGEQSGEHMASEQTAGDPHAAHDAAAEYDDSSVPVTKGQQTAADPPTASCGDPPISDDRAAKRARAAADLAARFGPAPPAWHDLTEAQTELIAASRADAPHDAEQSRRDLEAQLAAIARERGREPVPKPTPLPHMPAEPSPESWDEPPGQSYHWAD